MIKLKNLTVMSVCSLLFFFSCGPNDTSHRETATHYIEYLVFETDPEHIDSFVKLDEEIWTTFLSSQPGFISKEVWLNKSKPGELSLIVYWNSKAEWKSIPDSKLIETSRKFDQAFGQAYELKEEVHDENELVRVLQSFRK